jgi:ABC-type Zn uptake system ZnuABC Zn-binding protein ZnuA
VNAPRTTVRLGIRTLRVALAASVALAACGSTRSTTAPAADEIRVVASTTVLADLVAQVGGSKVSVRSLVPKGGEVHTFDPQPSDLADLARADLIVMNGLGLDDWLGGMAEDAGATAPIVRLGEDLPGVTYLAGEDAGTTNPHLWLNVAYARGTWRGSVRL